MVSLTGERVQIAFCCCLQFHGSTLTRLDTVWKSNWLALVWHCEQVSVLMCHWKCQCQRTCLRLVELIPMLIHVRSCKSVRLYALASQSQYYFRVHSQCSCTIGMSTRFVHSQFDSHQHIKVQIDPARDHSHTIKCYDLLRYICTTTTTVIIIIIAITLQTQSCTF